MEAELARALFRQQPSASSPEIRGSRLYLGNCESTLRLVSRYTKSRVSLLAVVRVGAHLSSTSLALRRLGLRVVFSVLLVRAWYQHGFALMDDMPLTPG